MDFIKNHILIPGFGATSPIQLYPFVLRKLHLILCIFLICYFAKCSLPVCIFISIRILTYFCIYSKNYIHIVPA